MTIKEQLHQMVDQMPEEEAHRLLKGLAGGDAGVLHKSATCGDSSTIGQILESLGREVPQEEWDRIPSDLTDRLDDHLYGSSKG